MIDLDYFLDRLLGMTEGAVSLVDVNSAIVHSVPCRGVLYVKSGR